MLNDSPCTLPKTKRNEPGPAAGVQIRAPSRSTLRRPWHEFVDAAMDLTMVAEWACPHHHEMPNIMLAQTDDVGKARITV